jgi:hypothetical protein
VLAQAIVRQMKTSHVFRHDFKEAKAEIDSWRRADFPTRSARWPGAAFEAAAPFGGTDARRR